MQKFATFLLAIALLMGQAPAWALSSRCTSMPTKSLDCVRLCTKSAALLTQGGKLAGIGQACSKVETRFAHASLAATTAPALSVPTLAFSLPLSHGSGSQASLSLVSRAHAPPSPLPAQAFLSVPVAQAPPALA